MICICKDPLSLGVVHRADAPCYIPEPKREWVGLTDEDIDLLEQLYSPPVHPNFVDDVDHCFTLIKKVEAVLKEKNT